jgi:lysophospholipase L1-like esterase
MDVNQLQRKFIANGVLLAPALPFLYLQGQITRWKVGKLPDAQGETSGEIVGNKEIINLLVIGESTVAGVGAKNHAEGLTGQFAKYLRLKTGKTVRWNALGVSGITIHRAIRELVPKIPPTDEVKFDAILIGLGGNDVFGLSTPQKWRNGLAELLDIFRKKYPNATIYVANVPMVREFIALKNPLRYVLSRVAKMQHFNSLDLISNYENAHYYLPRSKFLAEHFSDGIHPSALGYEKWAEDMVEFFFEKFGEKGKGKRAS